MATIIPFQPTQQQPFQFQAKLTNAAGTSAAYNVTVTWLYAAGLRGGTRYYVNIYDQNNTWIVTLPLIGSPPDYDISLTAGYFVTMLVYRAATGNFEVG